MPSSSTIDHPHPHQQNYSGFLGGFRSNGGGGSKQQQDGKHRSRKNNNNNNHDDDLEEAMSIVSVATSKNFYCSNNNNTKSKKHSSVLSVVSDLSNDEEEEQQDDFAGGTSHEFVLKCKNENMVFVSSIQGRMIKQRCRHFRLLLSAGGGGNIVVGGDNTTNSNNNTKSDNDNRILDKSTWSAGTARHVIELLTEGTTWIDDINSSSKHYKQLAAACDEIDVKLCIGSLINYHDLIDQRSTKKFFKLLVDNIKHFQFKIKAVVSSAQWLNLLQDKNILLMATNAKILMITVAPPGSKDATTTSPAAIATTNQDRLKKCDALYSEFCVYSQHGSKLNALLTILDVLQKSLKNVDTTKQQQQQQRKKKSIAAAAEHFKVSYQTRIGSIQEEHLNMLWRLTSASYTLATTEERKYLLKHHHVDVDSHHSVPTTAATTVPTSSHHHDNSETSSITSSDEDAASPVAVSVKHSASRRAITPSPPPPHPKFQYRTITSTSPMVLRNLFDPLNNSESDNYDKGLPASVSVTNPSPDTLGRFLNAAAASPGGKSIKVGFDLVDKNTTVFYVSSTSEAIKQVLQYLSNYENPAVIDGDNFVLQQYHHVVGCGSSGN